MSKASRKPIGWVAVLVCLAVLQHWIASRRPLPLELRARREFLVTTTADEGPGSLREAIFAAARAPGRARIRLPAGRLTVQSPLPPLVNGEGVVIEGTPGATELDAAGLEAGAALDIDAPGSLIHGVRIVNAAHQGIVVRKSGVRVVESAFENCDQGLHAATGVQDLVVERSTFTGNRIGVWLAAAPGRTEIRANRFSRHEDAAVWAVQRRGEGPLFGEVVAVGNRFDQDRISMVLANTSLLVENNEFTGARDAAIVILGEGAVVRNNRIRSGTGIGLIADDADGALIDDNEIDHNQAIGVLIRSSGAALIRGNRLYANGYGLAFVFGRPETPNVGAGNTLLQHTYDGVVVIGGSPVLRENRVLNGSLAGLRILDFYSSEGTRTPAHPLLQRNRVEGNGIDTAVRGEYRAPASQDPAQ